MVDIFEKTYSEYFVKYIVILNEGECNIVKYGNLKWLAILVSLLYLTYAYTRVVGSFSPIFDYVTLFVNWVAIGFLAVWFIKKANVKNTFDFLILCAFIVYLYVLHQFVSYINIGYYFTQEYIGNHHILFEQINLIPFKTIMGTINSPVFASVTVIQILGNIILLTPFAFALLSLDITKDVNKTVLITLLISIGIETHQLIESLLASGFKWGEGRAVDIDDVILNTLGGLIGTLFYKMYKRILLVFN